MVEIRRPAHWPISSISSSSKSGSEWRKLWCTAAGTAPQRLRSVSRVTFTSRSSSTRCLSVSRSWAHVAHRSVGGATLDRRLLLRCKESHPPLPHPWLFAAEGDCPSQGPGVRSNASVHQPAAPPEELWSPAGLHTAAAAPARHPPAHSHASEVMYKTHKFTVWQLLFLFCTTWVRNSLKVHYISIGKQRKLSNN